MGDAMSSRLILLVEDNDDDRLLTLRALREHRVANEVVVAEDGAQALELLFGPMALPELPQLVLLDLKLPRVDGLEVLRRIRADPRTRELPVVVLTTSRLDRDIVDSYSLGANAYVCKPVEFGEFISAVQTLGFFWLLLNVPPESARSP